MLITIPVCTGCNRPMQPMPEYLPNEYVFTCPTCIDAVLTQHNNIPNSQKAWKPDLYESHRAIKHDQGKLRYDLVPTDSLKELVKVFTYGVEKYADRNWEKGMEWGRIYGAIQRHLNAFWSGKEINEEDDNLSHLAQAAWGCLVLESYRLRKIGADTREKNGTDTDKQ